MFRAKFRHVSSGRLDHDSPSAQESACEPPIGRQTK